MPRTSRLTRALSHNAMDERALLGGLVLYQGGADLYQTVAEMLNATDFAVPAHVWLFRLLGDLVSQGKPTDLLAIADQIDLQGARAVDAPAAFEVQHMIDACTSVANVPTLAARVLEHARRRRVQEALIGALDLITDGNRPASEAAEYAASRIADLAPRRTSKDELARWHVATVLARMLQRPAPVAVAPLPGGYSSGGVSARPASELDPSADAAKWPTLGGLLGGWWADMLALLVGHTGRGKSSFALQIAATAARSGAPVLYASLEMGTDELVARLIALHGSAGASWSALKRGAYAPDAVAHAGSRLVADCPHLYLWAPDGPGRSIDGLQRMARAVSAAAEGRAPLVVLDYVQRLAAPASGSPTDDRRSAVADLSGRLRDLSRPGGLGDGWPGAAVLALSSTARAAYSIFSSTGNLRKASDLEGSGKESGELEYDASVVLCMTSDKPADSEVEPEAGRLVLWRVVKNREGRTGASWFRLDAVRGWSGETTAPPEPSPATGAAASPGRAKTPKYDPSLAD